MKNQIKLKDSQLKRLSQSFCESVNDGDTLGDLVDKFGRDSYIDFDYYGEEIDCIYIRGYKEESDEEYNSRIAQLIAIEEEKLKKKRDKDYKEYLRLKQIFEGNKDEASDSC